MEEWFFFYWIYMFRDYLPINQTPQSPSSVFSHPANTAFSFAYTAVMVTESTEHLVVFKLVIKKGLLHGNSSFVNPDNSKF
jgi:hypothetical protein